MFDSYHCNTSTLNIESSLCQFPFNAKYIDIQEKYDKVGTEFTMDIFLKHCEKYYSNKKDFKEMKVAKPMIVSKTKVKDEVLRVTRIRTILINFPLKQDWRSNFHNHNLKVKYA